MAFPSNAPQTRNGAIHGLAEIQAELRKLKTSVIKNINTSAARAGAREIQATADSGLPSHHRKQKKLDIERSRRRSRNGLDVFKIGPKKEHWPLVFYEYGADPFEIKPKTKKTLVFRSPDGKFQSFAGRGVSVQHPAIPRLRFLSKAVIDGRTSALNAISRKYKQRLKKIKTTRKLQSLGIKA